MEEKYYSVSVIPESDSVIFENWLNENGITYSKTNAVERRILDGSWETSESAIAYLLLMTAFEYSKMLDQFDIHQVGIETWKGDK